MLACRANIRARERMNQHAGTQRVSAIDISRAHASTRSVPHREQLSGEPTLEYSKIMSALEQRNKKQRAAPPQRDKRHAREDTLDDDDATTPALALELRTDGYRVAAMPRPAPLSVEAKRARGQQKPPERPLTFGELQPYGTAAATALLSAIDKRVLPREMAPGLAGVVRLRIIDRRPGGGGPREVACRVGDDDEAAAAPAPSEKKKRKGASPFADADAYFAAHPEQIDEDGDVEAPVVLPKKKKKRRTASR